MYAHAAATAADSAFTPSLLPNRPGNGSRPTAVTSMQRRLPGEVLFVEGDEASSVYEIVSGMLRLVKLLPDGRRQITGFLSARHLLGLAPEGVHVYSAEAITDVTVCRYGRAAFERLIEEVPGFAMRLFAQTSHELHANQDQMVLLGRKTATEKVASFLLMFAGEHGGDDAREVDMPITRCDIADYLGLTIETVSRIFTKLRQDGLIELPSPTRVKLRDRGRLEEFAMGAAD
jgi:CRP/FNR family transcriptional regulator, anaerobic regulatory protein